MNDLKNKAISIKGKSYVLVSDRLIAFNEEYPNGSIITSLVSEPTSQMVVIKAKVTPDIEKPERYFTGYSQATWGDGMVNKTAALENAETSAVGRALAFMGIGVIDSVASVDEIKKAENTDNKLINEFLNNMEEGVKEVKESIEKPELKPCPIHKGMSLYRKQKGSQVWYSHKLTDGSWCNGATEEE